VRQAELKELGLMMDDFEDFDDEEEVKAEGLAEPIELDKIKQIIATVGEGVELLFHTPDDLLYADVRVDGHRETLEIKGPRFKKFFRRESWKRGIALKADQLREIIANLEAQAQFDGPEINVYLRVAAVGDAIWIDLCDKDWRAIKVTADGWQVVATPAVRFIRARGMEPLPAPKQEGSIEDLEPLLNVRTEDFVLVVAFVLGALSGHKPFPILVLIGEHGTAKSFLVRFVRGLIDPSSTPLLAPPISNRDLFIAARNSFLLAYDNLSKLSPELSDSLARLSTGGGLRLRTLYTDTDETLISVARPLILNGIEDFVTREDLQSRAVILSLQPINTEDRATEDDLIAEFSRKQSYILGAFLDALVTGLRNPQPVVKHLPRMADWAVWCVRAGLHGILEAIETNQMNAVQVMLEANPLAICVRKLGERREVWKGTATELREVLVAVGYSDTEQSSSALSGNLRKVAPHLRTVGVDVRFLPRRAKARIIHITWVASSPSSPSQHE
jgi:hypothetical protein